MRPVTADTAPAHDVRSRNANYTGFQRPAMVFFCSHPGSGYHTSQVLTTIPGRAVPEARTVVLFGRLRRIAAGVFAIAGIKRPPANSSFQRRFALTSNLRLTA